MYLKSEHVLESGHRGGAVDQQGEMGSAAVRVTLEGRASCVPRWDRAHPLIVDLPRQRSSPRRSGSAASMPPSLNRKCPSCLKLFANDSSVLRHMNHPSTSCLSWFAYLESMSPPTHNETSHNHNTTHSDGVPLDDEPMGDLNMPSHEDIHPNTPRVFGSGPGFVDVFNSDRHAGKRSINIYYPFSSKEEWGLASWLSQSGLSMRAVDDFLALPIVRPRMGATGLLLTKT